MNIRRLPERAALLTAATALLLLSAAPALAGTATGLFGSGNNPLQALVDFMVGPFAYGLTIIGIVTTGASLIFGSDFSGFSRRMLLVAVAGAVVILADNVVTALFGGGAGASIPPDALLQAWPWPTDAEAGP